MATPHADLLGLLTEIAQRRTFAIISHPDAGKTTLTEKLLLFAGAVREAGAVRARRGARATTSDWMEFERRRGISISSTVLQFEYDGAVCNLLDTPGHADFGEDTYRTLCAADAAIMLLDAAKGLEPQTLKLFRICRARELPLITFVNSSALANFGVHRLLTSLIELAPPPVSFASEGDGRPRALDAAFSAFVFKIQANMNPRHRDRVAFLRVCSDSVERGLSTTVARTGRSLQLKFLHRTFGQERATIERAVAGDIVAVANARGLRIGDTLYCGDRVSFPALPSFPPERFAIARNADIVRDKQFRRGLAELAAQGVVQILLRPEIGMREPILAAVGELQFQVAEFRMAREFGCQIELSPTPWKRACLVDREHTPKLRGRWGIDLVEDSRGQPIALFLSERVLEATAEELPEIALPRPPDRDSDLSGFRDDATYTTSM